MNFHFHMRTVLKEALRIALVAAVVTGVPVLADDLSNGSWSTTDASNSAAPPNGWPAGMQPNQVEPAARSNMGALRRWWERSNPALSTTGSAGAYVLTPTNISYPTAYTQGETYCAKANFTSVGNDTLNVNSLGAKPLYAAGAVNLAANEIQSGQQLCVAYDSALNSGAGGFQVLSAGIPQFKTWTPTDQTVSPAGITVNDARYARIGNIVIVTFDITVNANANTNSFELSAPVTPITTMGAAIGVINTTGTAISAVAPIGNAPIILFKTTAGDAAVSESSVSGARIIGTIIYSA